MRTWSRFFCLLLVACLLLGFLEGESAAEGRDYRKTGIVVTGSYSWKPYSFLTPSNAPDGFLVSFWRRWSEKTGIPVRFKLVSWKESLALVAKGEADVHCGLFYTEGRSKLFDFSQPVAATRSVLVVADSVDCSDDLAALQWGTVAGSAEKLEIASLYPDAHVVDFKDSILLMEALGQGVIQASVNDEATVMMLGREMHIPLNVCETVVENDLLAVVQKGQSDLLEVVNQGLAQIDEDERRYLISRWFIGEESESEWEDMVTPVSIALLLSIGVWLWSMRRRSG